MTTLAFLFTLALGASLGAGVLGFFIMGKIADLEAENDELRLSLTEADDFDNAVAKLKAVFAEPEEAA